MRRSQLVAISIAMSIDNFTFEMLQEDLKRQLESRFKPESIPYLPKYSEPYQDHYPIKPEKLKVNEKPKAGGSKFIPLKGRR